MGAHHLRSGPGPTARERGRRREASTRRAVSQMSPSIERCIRMCDCTCICPVQSWTPCLPHSLRPVPFTPARAFLPCTAARRLWRGAEATASQPWPGARAAASAPWPEAQAAPAGSRTGAGPADRASARGRRRREVPAEGGPRCKSAIWPAARASCARSCGGCRTSTSGPSASRSSTAASMESIRTQASAQSPRPAAGGAPCRIRSAAGRPCRTASRRPRGDNRIRARPASGTGRGRSPRRLPGSSLRNPSISSKPPRRPGSRRRGPRRC